MNITVSGKGVDIGESFRAHVEKQIESEVSKYIDRVTSVQAVASREAHMFRVDITGHVGTHAGLVVRSTGQAGDIYAAFDVGLEKLAKQLRRYKRKITNHHKTHHVPEVDGLRMASARKYVLTPEAGEHEDDKTTPVVIAEKTTDIGMMTVSEAVMQMDLQELPTLLFYNSGNKRLNVVYRRADGNISWIDPE